MGLKTWIKHEAEKLLHSAEKPIEAAKGEVYKIEKDTRRDVGRALKYAWSEAKKIPHVADEALAEIKKEGKIAEQDTGRMLKRGWGDVKKYEHDAGRMLKKGWGDVKAGEHDMGRMLKTGWGDVKRLETVAQKDITEIEQFMQSEMKNSFNLIEWITNPKVLLIGGGAAFYFLVIRKDNNGDSMMDKMMKAKTAGASSGEITAGETMLEDNPELLL